MRWPLLVLLLSGCAGPHLTSGSASGGIVSSYGWQPNKALEVAQKHCAEFGKDAVVTSENDLQDHMIFQCVKR
jgi:hypothetical protein